jgi:tRNA(adenine34) deaminase
MRSLCVERTAWLVFSARDPKAGACGSIFDIPAERRLNHRVEVVGGLLEQESQILLQDFFRSKRRFMSGKLEHRPRATR